MFLFKRCRESATNNYVNRWTKFIPFLPLTEFYICYNLTSSLILFVIFVSGKLISIVSGLKRKVCNLDHDFTIKEHALVNIGLPWNKLLMTCAYTGCGKSQLTNLHITNKTDKNVERRNVIIEKCNLLICDLNKMLHLHLIFELQTIFSNTS